MTSGKPKTRAFIAGGEVFSFYNITMSCGCSFKLKARLKALRFDKQIEDGVSMLVELHLRFAHGSRNGAECDDSAIRGMYEDAGCTTATITY
jgi:hypothetical protein